MDNTSSIYLYVKLNWDANRFLQAESKDCMNSASYEYTYYKVYFIAKFSFWIANMRQPIFSQKQTTIHFLS